MKRKLALLALTAPFVFGAVVVFHPGVAFAETPLAKLPARALDPGTYTVDPMHTSVGFDIGHVGLSRVQGRFNEVSGKLVVDPKDLGKSSVTFRIGTASVDTAVAPRDAHLKTKDFFDVATYPEIVFASTKIAKKGKGYVATGNLTIHGVTKEIQIPFKATGPMDTGPTGVRVGIVSEPFQLNRLDFGVGDSTKMPNGAMALSPEVNVRLSLEASLDK